MTPVRRLDRDGEAFARSVLALEPYLAEVVFVGGWAHRLHALHPAASPLPFEPLRTLDADVAAPLGLAARDETIDERLRAAGFVQDVRGDEMPPISQYRLAENPGGFYVEFVTPLQGGERDRWGRRNATVRVAGVSAQRLRYVDVLLVAPWEVTVCDSNGFPLGPTGKKVLVANPVSFMVQKVLAFKNRDPARQGKDLLYLHDTLHLFAGAIPQLRRTWASVSPGMHEAHVRAFLRNASRLTRAVTDAARLASRMAGDSGRSPAPTPEDVTSACRAGCAAVFGIE